MISQLWETRKIVSGRVTCHTFSVLQIGNFQLVGQWAEGLKGILRPQLVQESCIFLLPRSTKSGENQCWFILYDIYLRYSHNNSYKLNWYYAHNIQEANNTKILSKYAFKHSFQEICIYSDWPRHPNGRQWPMTGHYLQRCILALRGILEGLGN